MPKTTTYLRGAENSQGAGQDFVGDLYDAAGNIVFLSETVESHTLLELNERRVEWVPVGRDCAVPDMYCIVARANGGCRAFFWNPDGTPEAICGNALRTIAHYGLSVYGISEQIVMTAAGALHVAVLDGDSCCELPVCAVTEYPGARNAYFVNPGTPHVVQVVDSIDDPNWVERGRWWTEQHLSATYVQRCSNDRLRVRTFERGVGETGSCATGAFSAYLLVTHLFPTSGRTAPVLAEYRSGNSLTLARVGRSVRVRGRCDLMVRSMRVSAHS